MKTGYYGVYGKNGGGIFTIWTDVQNYKVAIVGCKNKKFGNEIEALDYVIAGLVDDYAVISSDNVNEDKLLDNIGRFVSLKDLMLNRKKRVKPTKNYWGVPM